MLRLTAICIVFLPACLGQRVRIEGPELERMAATAPAERGQHVRTVQESAGVHIPGKRRPRVLGGVARTREGAALLMIVSPIVVPALLISEASRFDGWTDLPADTTLHLYRSRTRRGGGGDQWRHIRLNALQRPDAEWADGAVVDRPFFRFNRNPEIDAPLNRAGFGMSLEARGGASPNLQGAAPFGRRGAYGLRTSFSYFPHRLVGVAAVLDWGRNTGGRDARTGLEVQAFAPGFHRVNVGVYALLGYARHRRWDESEVTATGAYVDVGVILQLEMATRSALQLRFGASAFSGDWYPLFGVGVTIY